MKNTSKISWYFDFISPFSYLQWQRLKATTPPVAIDPVPLLFAGLLGHWENKGPAEIAPKRDWTYENCLWIAHHHGIPMRLPAHHPFNPLPLLRLCVALGSTHAVIDRLFGFVWQEGHLPTDSVEWTALLQELNVTPDMLAAPQVKAALKANGEDAIAQSVFGVPTAVMDGRRFWGVDATDMLLSYLAGDAFFSSAEFARAGNLPQGLQRKEVSG